MQEVKFAKLIVLVNGLTPLALLGWDGWRGNLGANPLEFVTRTTGTLALLFLVLSLVVTPLRKALGLPWMIHFRRMVGLLAFFYAFLHFITYAWFDKFFDVRAVAEDTYKRPFITFGMLAFFLLVPLAVTSTKGMVRRLGGRRWNRLHKLAYVAAIAGVTHYYMLVKADTRGPLWFAVILALLLGYRLINRIFPRWTERKPARARG